MLQQLVEAGPTPGHVSDHTDVTFNPFYDRQFGTVDQKGNWKLWDIEGAYAPSRKGSGLTLKNSTGGTLSTAEGQWDGWGRIVWGADVNTVIACDRQRAALFDIRVIFHETILRVRELMVPDKCCLQTKHWTVC